MSKDSILELRIYIEKTTDSGEKTGALKKMRFGLDFPVVAVLREIISKHIDEKLIHMQKDHGLFMPPNPVTGKKGLWLENHKTLRYYGIVTDDILHYEKRHRSMKVRLMDDTTEEILVDDSKIASEISESIGKKLNIKSFIEYSLRRFAKPPDRKAQWVDESMTLHEQDIPRDEELEYSRKFYFGDDYNDKEDKFMLRLLYCDAKKGVLEGRYLATRADAKDFAALQMQVEYGDHKPNHKERAFLNPTTFLPVEYQKDKKIIEEIVRDHKKLCGMNESNAKFRYVQLVRSLKTYGTTYFFCLEKMKNKRKTTPVLIGISKEKIIKTEPQTHRIIKEWTFNLMRRWHALKENFVIDFGDGEDDYLELLTDEGDAISSLIGGYINIILKSRTDHTRVIEQSQSSSEADIDNIDITPGMGDAAISAMYLPHFGQASGSSTTFGNITKVSGGGPQTATTSVPEQQATTSNVARSSRMEITDLGSATRASIMLCAELGEASLLPPTTALPEEAWKQQFHAHKANIVSTASDLLGYAKLNDNISRKHIDLKAAEMVADLREMTTASRNLASISNQNLPYLHSAKAVADSVTNLLKLLTSIDAENENSSLIQVALEEAKKSIQTGSLILEQAQLGATQMDQGTHLLLLNVVSSIDTKMDHLLNTIDLLVPYLPQQHQGTLSTNVKEIRNTKAINISKMKNLVPYALDPVVRDQIVISQDHLDNLAQVLVMNANTKATLTKEQQSVLGELGEALSEQFTVLTRAMKVAERFGYTPEGNVHSPALKLLDGLAALRSEVDDPKKVIDIITTLANVPQELTTCINRLYSEVENWNDDRLIKAADMVSEAIRDLMGTGKDYKQNDLEMREKILQEATELETQAYLIMSETGVYTALQALNYEAKTSMAALVRLTTTMSEYLGDIRDPNLSSDIESTLAKVKVVIPSVISAIDVIVKSPNIKDMSPQRQFIETARSYLPLLIHLTEVSKLAATTLSDAEKQEKLSKASQEATNEIHNLMKVMQEVSELGCEEQFYSILPEFEVVKGDLETAHFSIEQGLLSPIVGQSKDEAHKMLDLAINDIRYVANELVGAAKSGGSIVPHLQQMASLTTLIANTTLPVASSMVANRRAQQTLVVCSKRLVDNVVDLLSLSRALSIDPTKSRPKKALQRSHQVFCQTLDKLASVHVGIDVSDIPKSVEQLRCAAVSLQPVNGDESYEEVASRLNSAAKGLLTAVTQLQTDARTNPEKVGFQAKVTTKTALTLFNLASLAAGATDDEQLLQSLLDTAKELSERLVHFLPSAGNTALKKTPGHVQQLLDDTASVEATLNDLLSLLGTSGAAEKAANRLTGLMIAVDNNTQPVIAGSRQDILNEFLACAREFARVQASLINSARASDVTVGTFAREAANAAGRMVIAAKAASLADGTAPNLTIDGARIVRGVDYVQQNIDDTQKVYTITKQIIAATGNLIATAKARLREEPDATKRHQIVAHSQQLVAAASELAQASRTATIDKDKRSRAELEKCYRKLKQATVALESSLSPSSRQSSDPNLIPKEIAHKLMLDSRALALSTVDLIRASTTLMANPESKRAADDVGLKSSAASAALQGVLSSCGSLNPVVQKCEQVIAVLEKSALEIDAPLKPSTIATKQHSKTTDTHLPKLIDLCRLISSGVKELPSLLDESFSSSSDSLLSLLSQFERYGPDLSSTVLSFSSSSNRDDAERAQLVGDAKHILVHLTDAFKALKDCCCCASSDPATRAELLKASEMVNRTLGMLLQQLQTGASVSRELERCAQLIRDAIPHLTDGTLLPPPPPASQEQPVVPSSSYSLACETLASHACDIATQATHLLNTDKKHSGELGMIAHRITDGVTKLVKSVVACTTAASSTTSTNSTLPAELTDNAQQLLTDLSDLVMETKKAVEDGLDDEDKLKELFKRYHRVNACVSTLLATAQRGAVGEAMMEKAVGVIKGSLMKLNMGEINVRLAAAVGGDDSKKETATTAALREGCANAMKKVGDSVSELKKAVKLGGETDLGEAASTVAVDVSEAIEATLILLDRITDHEAQKELITLVKDVTAQANEMIMTAKHGLRYPEEPSTTRLMGAFSRDITEKLSKVIASLDSYSKDEERLRSEIEAHRQRLLALVQQQHHQQQPPPRSSSSSIDDALEHARSLLTATASFVFFPRQTAPEVSKTASTLAACAERVLRSARAVSAELGRSSDDDDDVQKGVMNASVNAVRAVVDLLECGKRDKKDEGLQKVLDEATWSVSSAVNSFVYAVKRLLPQDEPTITNEGTDDLEAKAEKELLKCAEIIANAAKTLMSTQRPQNKTSLSLDQEDINEAIIDAARLITEATGTLVKRAAAAQHERRFNDKHPRGGGATYHLDPMWANGLISGAQSVAGSVQQLVKAANAAAQGNAEEVALVASAQGVGVATAHLLTAARAKADASSVTQLKLSDAAGAVTTATKQLVSVARTANEFEEVEEEDVPRIAGGTTVGIRMEMEQQAKIAQLEQRLDQERRALLEMRKLRYRK